MQPDPQPLQHLIPAFTCFGCGPANPDGMHLQSYWSADQQTVVATYEPPAKFNAGFPNVMYGGTVASLIDCHSLWTAMAFAYRAEDREIGTLPVILYVTGELVVKYVRPTPLDLPIHLRAWVVRTEGRRSFVECELGPEGVVSAQGRITAIRVADGL